MLPEYVIIFSDYIIFSEYGTWVCYNILCQFAWEHAMAAEVEWVKDPDGGFGRIQMMLMVLKMMVLKLMVVLMIMNDDLDNYSLRSSDYKWRSGDYEWWSWWLRWPEENDRYWLIKGFNISTFLKKKFEAEKNKKLMGHHILAR